MFVHVWRFLRRHGNLLGRKHHGQALPQRRTGTGSEIARSQDSCRRRARDRRFGSASGQQVGERDLRRNRISGPRSRLARRRQSLSGASARKKNGYRGSSVDCPGCGQSAEFQGYRPLHPLSILGSLSLQRGYYYCHRCGGQFPFDDAVGLTPKRLTPAAEELTTLAGTTGESFQEAAEKLLPKMASIRVCTSTVQRTSEAAGQRLRDLLQQQKV